MERNLELLFFLLKSIRNPEVILDCSEPLSVRLSVCPSVTPAVSGVHGAGGQQKTNGTHFKKDQNL